MSSEPARRGRALALAIAGILLLGASLPRCGDDDVPRRDDHGDRLTPDAPPVPKPESRGVGDSAPG
jgi:hypothetical protein